MWEKNKMLVTSILFFSHNVFKRLFHSMCQKSSLCGSGLNGKILDCTKLKAFADDKFTVTNFSISGFDGRENNVGKGENAVYQHYLLFPQFSDGPFLKVVNS